MFIILYLYSFFQPSCITIVMTLSFALLISLYRYTRVPSFLCLYISIYKIHVRQSLLLIWLFYIDWKTTHEQACEARFHARKIEHLLSNILQSIQRTMTTMHYFSRTIFKWTSSLLTCLVCLIYLMISYFRMTGGYFLPDTWRWNSFVYRIIRELCD